MPAVMSWLTVSPQNTAYTLTLERTAPPKYCTFRVQAPRQLGTVASPRMGGDEDGCREREGAMRSTSARAGEAQSSRAGRTHLTTMPAPSPRFRLQQGLQPTATLLESP